MNQNFSVFSQRSQQPVKAQRGTHAIAVGLDVSRDRKLALIFN